MGSFPNLDNQSLVVPTVQDRVFARMMERVDAITNEDSTRLWATEGKQGPLVVKAGMSVPCFSMQQGPEQTIETLYPSITKIMTVYFEFRFQRILNVDSLVTFHYYLGKLQARLFGTRDNITLGGLALDVQEIGNNPEIDDQDDPMPGGLLMAQVKYRHYNGDPYHHYPTEQPNYAYGNE